MKNAAIKPEYFADIRQLRSLKTQDKIKEKGLDPEEGLLHALADTEGWKILKQFINDISDDLDDLTKVQMEKGATTSEIGATAVTVQLCKEILSKILNKVNDASETIEKEIIKDSKK